MSQLAYFFNKHLVTRDKLLSLVSLVSVCNFLYKKIVAEEEVVVHHCKRTGDLEQHCSLWKYTDKSMLTGKQL